MRTLTWTILLASAVAPSAFAEEPAGQLGYYLSFSGGYAGGYEYETEAYGTGATEGGWSLDGAFGERFSDHLRGEVALSYRTSSFKSGPSIAYFGTPGGVPGWYSVALEGDGLSVLSGDVNLYLDFPVGDGAVQPYVGVGAGIGAVTYDDGYYEADGSISFSPHVMAGSAVRVGGKASLFVESSYEWTNFSIESEARGSSEDLSFGGFSVTTGVRFAL